MIGKPKALPVISGTVQHTGLLRSPDGKYLCAGTFVGTIRRWEILDGTLKELPELSGHDGWVSALAFSADGATLFAGDSWGRLTAWSMVEKKPTTRWTKPTAHDGWIRSIAVFENTLASCSRGRSLMLWSAQDGKSTADIHTPDEPSACTFTPDGGRLLIGGLHGKVEYLDPKSGRVDRVISTPEFYRHDRLQEIGGLRVLSFTPDGKRLLIGGCKPSSGGFVQGTPLLKIVDSASGKEEQKLLLGGDSDGFVTRSAIHPTGCIILTTSGQPGQGKVLFLKPDAATPFQSISLPNCHGLALSKDGKFLFVSATNANSAGNGKVKGKDGSYPANSSPIHPFALPPA